MTKRMTSREARQNFADVLGMVYYGNEPVIVERKGKPVAVLISPEQYARFQEQANERFHDAVAELRQRNADKDPEEVYRDVTAAVGEVRQQQYAREHPTT